MIAGRHNQVSLIMLDIANRCVMRKWYKNWKKASDIKIEKCTCVCAHIMLKWQLVASTCNKNMKTKNK